MKSLTLDLFAPEPPAQPTAPVQAHTFLPQSEARAYRGGCYCRHRDRQGQRTPNPYRADTPEASAWARGYAEAGEFVR